MNDEIAEIVTGIDEDQIVVMTPDTMLEDGTRVKPIMRE